MSSSPAEEQGAVVESAGDSAAGSQSTENATPLTKTDSSQGENLFAQQTTPTVDSEGIAATNITANDHRPIKPASKNEADWQPTPGVLPHVETAAILKQVEFYFGDENLIQDAHLLSLTGEFGDGWVSLNQILGFKKMRQFKPASRVKASLHQSEKLQIWRNKLIRRVEPLKRPLLVTPKVDPIRERNQVLVDRPWTTKGMLKSTGYEEFAAEGPLKPADFEEDRRLYDPEEAFVVRIETAITRYQSNRKMHQNTLLLLTKFLMFGGFDAGQRQFVGGLSAKDLEEFDKDEIAQMKAQFAVSEAVLDGIGSMSGEDSWVVDFEGMAKAFLSSLFMASFDWKDESVVNSSTNILRNFYNYLLLHDVCPEFEDQLQAARDVCCLADSEFPKLAKVDYALPGMFNIACSTLHKGVYASMRPANPDAEWVMEGDNVGLSDRDAWTIFITTVSAHCDKDQLATVAAAADAKSRLLTISEERVGLKVVFVEYATGQAKTIYEDDRLKQTFVKPMGKLHCIVWDVPQAPPKDLPEHGNKAMRSRCGKAYEFFMEEDVLRNCYPGLKFEAVVKELETGTKWVDSFTYVYPSFFNWTLNERIREWKEPGPPKAWQQRQNAKKKRDAGKYFAQEMDNQAHDPLA